MGSRAIKHEAVGMGPAVGRRDQKSMSATGPKGYETNPVERRSGRP
jgi:hypothetical protein